MERNLSKVDELLRDQRELQAKLENQAKTLAAIRRKSLSLKEQEEAVRRNFVRVSKRISKLSTDLLSSISNNGGITGEQKAEIDEIYEDFKSVLETVRSLELVSSKGN